MNKLLIVDDNLIAREGMREILNWSDYGIEIAALCQNGSEALEYIKNHEVDIILSDVEMPVLNGVELLKTLRSEGNNVKFLFMSCYDEFDFVKKAIDMEATGYILKPVIAEELENAILKILRIYKEKNEDEKQKAFFMNMLDESLPVLREHFFRELIFGIKRDSGQIEESLRLLKLKLESPFYLKIALIKIYKDENNRLYYDSENIIAGMAISDMIKSLNVNDILIHPVVISGSDIAVVSVYKSILSDSVMDIYIKIKEYCQETLKIKTFFGVSNESDSLNEAAKLYKQAETAINTNFYSEDDRLIFFSDVDTADESIINNIDIKELQKEVRRIIAECDILLAEGFLSEYLTGQTENKSFVKYFSLLLLNLIEITLIASNIDFNTIIDHSIIWKKLSNMETIHNIKQWFINIFKSVFETIEMSKKLKDKNLAEKIKEIIEAGYSRHITIDYIAERVYFSGVYINNIFKKETGMAVFDYLLECRMKKAAELLKEPNSKIYLVAQLVGYKNQAHFKLLFKKYSGMTPMQYKSIYENRDNF